MTNETPRQTAVTVEDHKLLRELHSDYRLSWEKRAAISRVLHTLDHLTQQSAATGGEVSSVMDEMALNGVTGIGLVAPDVAARQLMGLYYELSGMPDMAADVRSDDWEAGTGFGPGSERQLLTVFASLVKAVRTEATSAHPNDMARENERLREALDGACNLAEGLINTHDYLGTGSSMKIANAEEREDQKKLASFRSALPTTPSNPPAPSDGVLREALERIARWHGEFPETGRFWDAHHGDGGTVPMSYAAYFGSNGERDYMRAVARDALDREKRS